MEGEKFLEKTGGTPKGQTRSESEVRYRTLFLGWSIHFSFTSILSNDVHFVTLRMYYSHIQEKEKEEQKLERKGTMIETAESGEKFLEKTGGTPKSKTRSGEKKKASKKVLHFFE
jgi:hypothetical protein